MKTKRLPTVTGSLAILNTGAGDIRVSFNDQDDAETDRAIAMLLDMQKRGYAIMVLQDDGSYLRAVAINRETKSYVVIPPTSTETPTSEDEKPAKRGKGKRVEQPARGRRAVGVARSAIQGAAQISLRDANAMRVAGLDRELMAQGCAPQQGIVSRNPFLVQSAAPAGRGAHSLDASMPAVLGSDRHALVEPRAAVDINDCYFRMLQPQEIGAAMAFPGDYTVLGNKRDRVKQYGNAVTPPVMETLIERHVQSLTGERVA